MKKTLSLVLSALMLSTAAIGCAPAKDRLDPAITLASSDARTYAEWLDERLEGDIPNDVVVGMGSNENYGVDMTDFEDDGYIVRTIGDETLIFGKTADGLDRAVREYAKAADVNATAELDTVYHEGARIKKLTIDNRDISEYTIVFNYDREVKNSAINLPTFGNAKYAAEELSRLIEQATGIELRPEPMDESITGPIIQIDYYAGDDLGKNGFTYKVENGNIYMNGVGEANGCANAVYYFLEHECGWDALLFGDSDLQPREHLNIENGTEQKIKPMFDYWHMREMYQDGFDSDKSKFSLTYRGSIKMAGHGITKWSSDNQSSAHMCYSDEWNYQEVYENVWNHVTDLVNSDKKIDEDIVTISIGQADVGVFCQCKTCLNVFKEENNAQAGAIIRFANRLAEDMYADYPGLIYTLFAYWGTNKPCKTAPRDDVYITYCTDAVCANHKLDGSECTQEYVHGTFSPNPLHNRDFVEYLRGWSELTDNIYVYHYLMRANFAEYTQIYTLYDDLHLLADIGVKGFQPLAGYSGLGLNRLRFQLMMDIIWHPEMSEEEYNIRMDEHMRREYGDGYEFVKSYIGIWRETEVNTGCWRAWFFAYLILPHRYGSESYDIDMYCERAPEMYDLLELALAQCNTAKQESRIKRLMCDVLYKECSNQYFAAYDTENTEKLKYLEDRYNLFVEYMLYCGYDFDQNRIPNQKTFGPSVKVIQDNIEDAAWIDWLEWRDFLTPEGVEQRPMPEKYAAVTE